MISRLPAYRRTLLKRFSRRTALMIEKLAEERGITDPDRKAELGAESRENKGKSLGWEQLRKEWNSRLTDKERGELAAVHRREHVPARQEHGEGMAVDHAIEHSFVREAVLPERKLLPERPGLPLRQLREGGVLYAGEAAWQGLRTRTPPG